MKLSQSNPKLKIFLKIQKAKIIIIIIIIKIIEKKLNQISNLF